MTRPARIEDVELAAQVRRHMTERGLSARQLADMVSVDKSTLGRSLEAAAFSRVVRQRLRDIVDPIAEGEPVAERLRKALRLISASDRLRELADRILIEALDQSAARK